MISLTLGGSVAVDSHSPRCGSLEMLCSSNAAVQENRANESSPADNNATVVESGSTTVTARKVSDVDDAAIQTLQHWAGEQFCSVMNHMVLMQQQLQQQSEQMTLIQQQSIRLALRCRSVIEFSVCAACTPNPSSVPGDAVDTVESLKGQIRELTELVKSLEAKNAQLTEENNRLKHKHS